ncbi:MAG: c-type cytochrome [Vicinamibacterales bacterium]|nr:c-type cytochrome [Vicinamibacterales bacterium]
MSWMRVLCLATASCVWVLVWVGPETAMAQAARHSVWDGVYTAAQATRGRDAYQKHCAGCHGNKLEGLGLGNGPALQGQRFVETWEGNLFALFDFMRSPMPRAEDVVVPDPAVLDTLAYVLEQNGMPAGKDELKPDGLALVTFVGKSGPTEVRDMALGRALGCLEAGPNNSWVLARATAISKSRDGVASSETELGSMKSEKLGTASYTLLDVFPAPAEHKGHRMEAKGIVIKTSNSINVTSLQMVDAACGQ